MHWYTADGRAPTMVDYADPRKGQRKATLRDARKYGWAPGVTDVLKVLDKPGLNNWRVEQAVLVARRLIENEPDLLRLPEEAFLGLVRSAEDTSKRDIGVEIHKDIERAIKGEPHGNRHIVNRVLETLPAETFSSEVAVYAKPNRAYGGTIDLLGAEWIIDIKTKETLGDRMVWDEHHMQLAAYRYALLHQGQGTLRCANLFVDYTGDVELIEHEDDELARGLGMFTTALELWYLTRRM